MKEKFCNIISHRGYHGNGLLENTLEAFSKSLQNALPIELDVYLTKDQKLVVFHDKTLKRMMGIKRNVEDCTYQELLSYSFLKGPSKIPLLKEVLELIQGKVLLLIEVKRCRNYQVTCKKILEELKNYSGKVEIQSFDFRIVRWFLKKSKYRTGLLVSPDPKKQNYFYHKLVNSSFFVSSIIKPDFVSFDIRGLPCAFIGKLKSKDMPIYLWTIRSEEELEFAKKHGSFYISEELGSFH